MNETIQIYHVFIMLKSHLAEMRHPKSWAIGAPKNPYSNLQPPQGLHLARQGFHIADGQDIVSQDVALHQSGQKRVRVSMAMGV